MDTSPALLDLGCPHSLTISTPSGVRSAPGTRGRPALPDVWPRRCTTHTDSGPPQLVHAGARARLRPIWRVLPRRAVPHRPRRAQACAQVLAHRRLAYRSGSAQLVGQPLPPSHRRRSEPRLRPLPTAPLAVYRCAARRLGRAGAPRAPPDHRGGAGGADDGVHHDADMHTFYGHQVGVRTNAD